jgi:hypothetical protein
MAEFCVSGRILPVQMIIRICKSQPNQHHKLLRPMCCVPVMGKCMIYWPCLPGKDIVFRFIIEYSSLRDFGPSVIGLFL